MAKTHPCLVEIMKLVDLMEEMGIMKNLYTKVKWKSITPIREIEFFPIHSTKPPLGHTCLPSYIHKGGKLMPWIQKVWGMSGKLQKGNTMP